MKFKDIFWIVFAIVIFGYFFYTIGKNTLADHISSKNAVHTKAVIIDEKNYMGNQKVNPEFSYSYLFIVNGEKYKGNAHDISLQVGDTIDVEYDKKHPGINRTLHPIN
jgi:hypothetical protein